MLSTLWHLHVNRPANDPSPMAAMARKYHQNCWGDDFPSNGRRFFRRHNELVREASRGRRFLEYQPGDGWEPLCEFLGVEVPGEEYPRSDDWGEYKRRVAEEKGMEKGEGRGGSR
jgi:hypothetical protein